MVAVNPPQTAPIRVVTEGDGEETNSTVEELGYGVDATHPDYDTLLPSWTVLRDAIEGEWAVKKKNEEYLPKPSGFTAQDDKGVKMYSNYLLRAKFPEILGPTLRGLVGIIHRVEADIQLPKVLEPLREISTWDGLSLNALHQRVTYELLATGRYGLLADMPVDATKGALPYIVGYTAEQIINWDSLTQDFYVLDESYLKRVGFTWLDTKRYRVCLLGGQERDEKGVIVPNTTGTYQQLVYELGSMTAVEMTEPSMKGGKNFDEVPFVVIGSNDVTPDVDEMPLISVARSAYTMYRLYADYYWQLFMSGQETLFIYTGAALENPVKIVGAGVVQQLPEGSQAEYVGPSGVGIASHKTAIDDERDAAVIAGARLFDTVRKAQESGEALKMRWAAQTASVTSIAINSAKGLEQALKYCAMFMGANPDEVIVTPNLTFIDTTLDPQKATYLMQLWMGGAISKETLYENLQRGEIATYERDFEEEEELIKRDMPDLGVGGVLSPAAKAAGGTSASSSPGPVGKVGPGGAGTLSRGGAGTTGPTKFKETIQTTTVQRQQTPVAANTNTRRTTRTTRTTPRTT